MTTSDINNDKKNRIVHSVCVNLAIVAAVLMAGAGFVLVRDWSPTLTASTIDSEVIEALRAQLADEPQNGALRDRVRQYDRELREVFFAQQQRARRAGIFMLVCGGVLALAMKTIMDTRKRLPMPQGKHDPSGYGLMNGWAGYGFVLVAVSAVVLLAVRSDRSGVTAPAAGQLEAPVAEARPEPSPTDDPQPAEALAWPGPDQFKQNWYRFRGFEGAGVWSGPAQPDRWDMASGEGVLWKLPVELPGKNSPVVWGDKLFFTCADENQRIICAVDCVKGEYLWQVKLDVKGSPAEAPEVMEDTGFAAPTCATDDQRVYAIFANGDVAAVSHAGELLWALNLGLPESTYGYAASLELYQGRLLIQYDQGYEDEGKSKVHALDVRTGQTVWSHTRAVGNSWSSPLVAHTGGRDQYITISNPLAIAYEPLQGGVLWQAACLAGDVAPSPVCANDLVYLITPSEAVRAYKTDGQGDVTETHRVWEGMDVIPDTCSPLTDGQRFYMLCGYDLVCYNALGGAVLWEHSFDENHTASPSMAGGKLIVMDVKGNVSLIEPADEFVLLGTLSMGEPVHACPAFAPGRMFVRTDGQIVAIGAR